MKLSRLQVPDKEIWSPQTIVLVIVKCDGLVVVVVRQTMVPPCLSQK